MPAPFRHIPVITGPTGSGKTALAVTCARATGAVIISVDSRQVYRYMDIGTAKPDEHERTAPHYLIDIRNPDESYSAGEFRNDALELIARFQREGQPFILAGGSGFYLDALMHGVLSGQPADDGVRDALRQRLDTEGAAVLYDELAGRDPASASRVHPNDHYRLIRALEINEITGRPVEQPASSGEEDRYRLYALGMDRNVLYDRINRRVDAMMDAGLEQEVRSLAERGYGPGLNALKTVGYAEMFAYFAGRMPRADAVELVKRHTRQYAKRQLTWFRRHTVTWLDAARGTAALAEQLCAGRTA